MSRHEPQWGFLHAYNVLRGRYSPLPSESQLEERRQFLRGVQRTATVPPTLPMSRIPYAYQFGGPNATMVNRSGGKVKHPYRALAKRYKKFKKGTRGALVSRSAFRSLPSELKVNDISVGSGLPQTAAAGFLLLNGIASGTDYNTRVGRQAWIKSIDYRVRVYPGATTNQPGGYIRWAIVCDEQPNGTQPAWTDIWASSGINDFGNLNNRDRFRIIRDKFVTIGGVDMSATGAGLNGNQDRFYKGRAKPNVGVTTFNGTGGTYTAINTCALWFVYATDYPGSTFYINARFRVRFVDE